MGIRHRVAVLWGFCGAHQSLWLARPTDKGPRYRGFRILMVTVAQRHRSGLPACGNSTPLPTLDGPQMHPMDHEAYAKVSLKKYEPMAARNEDRNVSSGLL